jgi:tRNA (guanine37-N1)-methyltransferase
MKVFILTIFPEIFDSFIKTSLIGKAVQNDILSFELINIRNFSKPPHNQVDDSPFGGGAGMTMKPEPLSEATEFAKSKAPNAPVILLSPRGEKFSQKKAQAFSTLSDIILVCGRYEGIDQRYIEMHVDEEISVGDYILMGGEVAAMNVIEATVRLIEGVIGNFSSTTDESFTGENELLEYPQYTRPAEYKGKKVPEVLLSGDHAKIKQWRYEESVKLTKIKRPDLIKN